MGKQVADNRGPHIQLEVHRHPTGELYCVHKPIHYPVRIRKEYIPVGLELKYPKKWEKWRAEELVVGSRMADLQQIIQQAQADLEELLPLWEGIQKRKEESEG